jgi:hypothetical protein
MWMMKSSATTMTLQVLLDLSSSFSAIWGFLKMGDHQDHRFQYYDLDDSGAPPLEETSIIFHFLTAR